MQLALRIWKPRFGESISGHILYFNNPDRSFICVLRSSEHYFVLPPDLGDILRFAKPQDGSRVQVHHLPEGYRISLLIEHKSPAESKTVA